MQGKNPIRVAIIDDYDVVREELVGFLKAFKPFELVGEARSGTEAIRLCEELKPDVVLMDLIMPQLNTVEAIEAIRRVSPLTKMIVFTDFNGDDWLQQALKSGAIGYLLKTASIRDIAAAIIAAHSGKATVTIKASQSPTHDHQGKGADHSLTAREQAILRQMVAGRTNSEIAEQLDLSRSTVKFHVSAILAKLNVATRTEAVAWAIKNRLFVE